MVLPIKRYFYSIIWVKSSVPLDAVKKIEMENDDQCLEPGIESLFHQYKFGGTLWVACCGGGCSRGYGFATIRHFTFRKKCVEEVPTRQCMVIISVFIHVRLHFLGRFLLLQLTGPHTCAVANGVQSIKRGLAHATRHATHRCRRMLFTIKGGRTSCTVSTGKIEDG